MDTPLSPRDIQTRIRAGESLEDVVTGSGLDAERVERFAAPVLAEREHLALTALGSSVRRRGESSGHRPLRAVVAERLLTQGVDADDVGWDAWKRDDNDWQVTADFTLAGEPRHAEFHFDPQGRFSLAEDDDARWLTGERPSPVTAAVDRDDELALVRATREPSDAPADQPAGPADVDADADVDDALLEDADELGAVLQVVAPVELSEEELAQLVADDPESDDAGETSRPEHAAQIDEDDATVVPLRDEATEPTIAVVRHLTRVTVEVDATADDPDDAGERASHDARSALDTLYDLLGGDGYAEDSARVYAGLSDAAAVPMVDEHEFEPPADVLVPAEPGPEAAEETDTEPAASDDDAPHDDAPGDDPAGEETLPAAAQAPPVPLDVAEPLIPSPGAPRTPGRRKRAAVPSWDEIMFGGPKPG
jgi:hypothetical protein